MREVQLDLLLNNIILNVVNYSTPTKTATKGRPKKCSDKEYLDAIFYVLKHGIGWEYLKGYPVKGDTVRKVFAKWSNSKVFYISWMIILDIYQEFKLDFGQLFIDASHIKNQLGTDYVGANVYDRFRKGTKITFITDDIGSPIGISIGPSNRHDITFVESTLDDVKVDIESTKFLGGDKGYISNDLRTKISNKFKIQLITPRRRKKGQKGKIRGRKPKGHKILKQRFIVEHSFSWFKYYGRLVRRKDKLVKNFQGFVFFGAALIVAKKLKQYVFN